MLLALLFASFTTTVALAADHKVIVGSGGLNFEPSSVEAAVGDTVTFAFPGSTHTATASTFARPCQANAAAAFSAVPPGETVFTVESSNATWFFCATGSHCASGMVFAINPAPEGQEKSFSNFKALAMGKSVAPGSSSTGSAETSQASRSASASASSPTGSSAAGGGSNGGSSSSAPTAKGLFVAGFVGGTLAVLCGLGSGL